jgi:hypothetical protein
MIKLLIILCFLVSNCNAQTNAAGRNNVNYVPYVFNWKSNAELGVVSYKVQRSYNNHNWVTMTNLLPKFKPDSNLYQVNLPNTKYPYYYKIVAVMVNGSYSSTPIYLRTTSQ